MNKKLILKTFAEVRWLRKFKTKDELKKYQAENLKKHLDFVRENSPYFKKLNLKKLEDYPLMDKKVMMDNFDKMNTAGIKKSEALKLAIDSEKSRDFKDKLKGYSVGLSSGTSGHRGVFVLSDDEIATWVGGMMAKMLPKGKILRNKVAFFLRADNNLYESSNSKVLKFEFFDILKPIEENVEKLQKFQPSILVAPPSVLLLLAKAVEEGRLSIKPAKIISVAEVLTDEDKKYFEKVFKKKISQVYQCTEGFLGYTCECGSLHINEDVVYIEKEYLDKNRFVPIITDFIRKTQPIIRYRLNDILVEDKRPCKCGSKLLRLKKIEGRLDDVFLFNDKNGKEITVFPDFISRVVLYVPKIKDYKVTQTKKDEVVFALDNLEKSTQKKITAEFKALSKKMKFVMPKLKFETFVPDYSRKMKRIERKIK